MNFEPFAVQCLTCDSRLRVTDPSIVNTIATCPKCNSMVEIKRSSANGAPTSQPPPAVGNQQVAVGASSVDSGAITEDAINADAGDALDPDAVPRGFTSDATVSPTAAASAEAIGGPMPPSWENPRTQRSRQIGLIVALAGAGLLGAILLFGWFVKNWRASGDIAAASDTANVEPVTADVDPDLELVESPESAPKDGDSVQEDSAQSDPTQGDPAQDAVAETPATGETEPRVAPISIEDKEPELESPVAPPSDLLPTSPLDMAAPDSPLPVDPAAINPGDPGNPGDASDDAEAPAAPPKGFVEPPPELRKFLDVLQLDGDERPPALAAPTTLDEIRIDAPAREELDLQQILTPPEPINFRRAMAIRLALSPDKEGVYPLGDLMLLLSQISGVPIQIDWVSFDLIGVGIRDGVKIPKGWHTVGDFLDKVAGSLGATAKRDELMITLEVDNDVLDTKLNTILSLDDFGGGQASAAIVLNTFLTGESHPAPLRIGDTTYEKQLAALAVESLRRMRGIKPLVPDSVMARWTESSNDPDLDWPIVTGGPAGAQFNAPLSAAGLLRRLARNSDSSCFVNWVDATRRRLSPEQLVMPFMGDDVGSVLEKSLSPFALQTRQVDSDHWWVGTEATYDRFPVITWSQPLGATQDAFIKRINQAAGAHDRSLFRLTIDPDSDRALMLLPRYLIRQLPKLMKAPIAKAKNGIQR